jgi:hypothetical protein
MGLVKSDLDVVEFHPLHPPVPPVLGHRRRFARRDCHDSACGLSGAVLEPAGAKVFRNGADAVLLFACAHGEGSRGASHCGVDGIDGRDVVWDAAGLEKKLCGLAKCDLCRS